MAAKSKANEAPAGEMKQLQLDESAVPKNKKLDVLKEFEKSDNKRSASFVVVGMYFSPHFLELYLTSYRSRRCRKEYPHGQATARAQVC